MAVIKNQQALLPLFLVILHIASYCLCNAKVIVFFPVPATSHIRYYTNVARATAELGHTPWVCIPDYVAERNHVDTTGINVLNYGKSMGDLESKVQDTMKINETFWQNKTQQLKFMLQVMTFFDEALTTVVESDFVDNVNSLKPDLFVIDGLPFIKRIFVVPFKLGIPYAVLGTMHDVLGYRIPFSPASTPSQLFASNDQMDFFGRLHSAVTYFVFMVQPFLVDPDVASIYAPDKPHKTLSNIVANAEIYIIELDPILDYPRPTLPNVKLIGATTVRDAKPLKDPFKSFLDKATKGVILVSFGSMQLVDIPRFIFDKINNACLATGMDIVWRSEEISPNPKKILTSNWIPQNDILGHKNTKLFISHCGKNGQYESLYHGVHILCLPIANDQLYNAERIRTKGYGLKADMRFVTTEELTHMVKELISNTTYKNNMVKASKLFRLFYKSPTNESAFWLDHVMEFGGDYMRAASQKMPYYQFLMLDVLAVVFLVLVLVLVIVFYVVRCCVRCVCCRSRGVKSKAKSE